jgi:hypothetical protein
VLGEQPAVENVVHQIFLLNRRPKISSTDYVKVLFKWYKVIDESGNAFTAVTVGRSITQAIAFRAFCN